MRTLGAWLLCVAFGAGVVRAQPATVQLPSYRYFTTNTTVSVPDRGSASLGGVNRARSGSNEFGTPLTPFRNRASGSELSASGASVSVYIHDFAAMEEELLGRGSGPDRTLVRSSDGSRSSAGVAARGGDLRSEIPTGSGGPRRELGQVTSDPTALSLEAIRRQRELEREARQSEAEDFFQRALAAEADGKANVARIYYQMAARRASGDFKTEVLAKLDSLRREQVPKVAQKAPQEPRGP